MPRPRKKFIRLAPEIADVVAAIAWKTGRSHRAVLDDVLREAFSEPYVALVTEWTVAGRPARRLGVRPPK
jgi:hypothetical protein